MHPGQHLRADRRSGEPALCRGRLRHRRHPAAARSALSRGEFPRLLRSRLRAASRRCTSSPAGFPRTARVDELESAVRTVCEPIFNKPLKEISFAQVLLRLFETARRFDMQIQPQLVLLQKTLLNVEGLGRQLYPELDLWKTAQPVLRQWMRERMSPRDGAEARARPAARHHRGAEGAARSLFQTRGARSLRGTACGCRSRTADSRSCAASCAAIRPAPRPRARRRGALALRLRVAGARRRSTAGSRWAQLAAAAVRSPGIDP